MLAFAHLTLFQAETSMAIAVGLLCADRLFGKILFVALAFAQYAYAWQLSGTGLFSTDWWWWSETNDRVIYRGCVLSFHACIWIAFAFRIVYTWNSEFAWRIKFRESAIVVVVIAIALALFKITFA